MLSFPIIRWGKLHADSRHGKMIFNSCMNNKHTLQTWTVFSILPYATLFILFCAQEDSAAKTSGVPKIAVAYRASEDRIKIDGRLTEAIWKKASTLSDFVQYEPDEGKPATEPTYVQVLYDDDALYVGMRAVDSKADKIRGCLTRRDLDSPSDWLGFAVDSYADRRTAFVFLVNPSGVKLDSRLSDDNVQDLNWDAVWDVGIKLYQQGWVAEFRIPYSQLRFPNQREQSWGFQAMRVVARRNETTYWSPRPKDAAGFVSLFGVLRGLINLPNSKKMQVLPYLKATSENRPVAQRHPQIDNPLQNYDAGLDLKYPLASNMALDVSINPDFGQVESDPSVFNLTAYETYYDEKRPFFLEGSHLFYYKVGIGYGDMAGGQLFYSRRIGRPPSKPVPPAAGLGVLQPRATRILGAAKVSGRSAGGWSIGLMDAVTPEETATLYDQAGKRQEVVEPMTNYFVSRLQRDFNHGNTTIGGIATNVTRQLPTATILGLNRTASSAGIDFSHKWDNNTYCLDIALMASHISGDTSAIQAAQLSSARYYQRSDAYHLSYDPGRTSLTGYAGKFYFRKISTGHWRWALAAMSRSPGFEVNDIGYLKTADYNAAFFWLGFNEYKPGPLFRDYNFSAQVSRSWTFGAELIGTGLQLAWQGRFYNYNTLYLGLVREAEALDTGLLRGGPAFRTPGHTQLIGQLGTDDRKPVQLSLYGSHDRNDSGLDSWLVSPSITFRPAGRLNFTVTGTYASGLDDLQYVTTFVENASPRYLLARLARKTFYTTLRFNLTLTPNLTIQYYGMPYVTAGQYQNFHLAAATRADRYADRLQDYSYPYSLDFNFQEFKSNLVLRWEYASGSTIYFVWSQGITNYGRNAKFNIADDAKSLFAAQSENIFLLKISRWLSF